VSGADLATPAYALRHGGVPPYNQLVRLAAIGLVAVLGRVAHAEGESALSVSVGWASFSVPGKAMGNQAPTALSPDVGGALAVSYEHAISTELSLRGELAAGVFHGGAQAMQGQTSYAAVGDAGIAFRFDVLKVVPYAFAGLGGVAAGGGPIDRGAAFAVVVGGGVDWLESRHRSLGLEARVASFGGDITVATFGVRGTLRWGAF
jgi:hypothetical protein